MLQNAYSLAKVGADTAGNERHFAEHLPKIGNYAGVRGGPWRLLGPPVAGPEVRGRLAGARRGPRLGVNRRPASKISKIETVTFCNC